jgi:hypothetical protein
MVHTSKSCLDRSRPSMACSEHSWNESLTSFWSPVSHLLLGHQNNHLLRYRASSCYDFLSLPDALYICTSLETFLSGCARYDSLFTDDRRKTTGDDGSITGPRPGFLTAVTVHREEDWAASEMAANVSHGASAFYNRMLCLHKNTLGLSSQLPLPWSARPGILWTLVSISAHSFGASHLLFR